MEPRKNTHVEIPDHIVHKTLRFDPVNVFWCALVAAFGIAIGPLFVKLIEVVALAAIRNGVQ